MALPPNLAQAAPPDTPAAMAPPQCRGITEAGERCKALGSVLPADEYGPARMHYFCNEHGEQDPWVVTYETAMDERRDNADEEDDIYIDEDGDWWYAIPGWLDGTVPVAGGGQLKICVHPHRICNNDGILTVQGRLRLPGHAGNAGAIIAHQFERGSMHWPSSHQFCWAVNAISDEAAHGRRTFLDRHTMGNIKPAMMAPPYNIPPSCSTGMCINIAEVAIHPALKGSGLGMRMLAAFLRVLDWSFCFTDLSPLNWEAIVHGGPDGVPHWPPTGAELNTTAHTFDLPVDAEPPNVERQRLAKLDEVKHKLHNRFAVLGFQHAVGVSHMSPGERDRYHWLSREAFHAQRWSPKLHAYACATVRERVRTLLLVGCRLARDQGQLVPLPTEMWVHILGVCGGADDV
eukprot:m.16168 g.16168  ORF g.16168 m.16168 type:complete len:403 (+) comp3362_c0_seq1:98-1306(+)